MRVAYVCADPDVPAFSSTAGSSPVREMCTAMIDLGFDVSLFVANRGGAPPARMADLRIVDLKTPTAADPANREREAVVANGETAMALAAAGPFDIIYERASLWSAAPMHYARRVSTIGILELPSPIPSERLGGGTRSRTLVTHALLPASLRAAQVVMASTDELAAEAAAISDGEAHIHVVPKGWDVQRLVQVSRDVGRGNFVVGYVGALEAGHGIGTLVDAFATLVAMSVPHAQLLVVGAGPERTELLRRTALRGLSDRVTCVDGLNADLPALLAKMNVAVAPHTDETILPPLTVIECMAAGLPVVASATSPFSSIVRHNQTGVLFTPGDAAGLASALGQLHADPLRLRHLAHEARAYAAGHFGCGRSLERILALAYTRPRETSRTGAA